MSAVPRSARYLQLEDKEGNQLWRFVVMGNKLDNYMNEARKAGLNVKRFSYDMEKYKADQQEKTKLEQKMELQKVTPHFPNYAINNKEEIAFSLFNLHMALTMMMYICIDPTCHQELLRFQWSVHRLDALEGHESIHWWCAKIRHSPQVLYRYHKPNQRQREVDFELDERGFLWPRNERDVRIKRGC